MDYLDKNLAVIASTQPGLASLLHGVAPREGVQIQSSRKGYPALLVGQNRLTSSVDPLAEGLSLAKAVSAEKVVVLGFGLGYHIEPLAARQKVKVWEPDAGLLKLALSARDCSAWLANCHIAIQKEGLGDIAGYQPFIPRALERLYELEAAVLLRVLNSGGVERTPRPEQPRVLIIPPIQGGTLDPAYWCADALKSMGCAVRTIGNENVAPLYDWVRTCRRGDERIARVMAPMMRFLGELAVLEAEQFSPHLILALAQAPLDRKALKELRSMGATTAFWFVEDFRQMKYFAEVAASYDYFFYIQGQELAEQLDKLGANHHFLPVAAHPPCHRPLGLSPMEQERIGAPIGFMGAAYPNRMQILGRLAEQNIPMKIWGVGWPTSGAIGRVLQENRYIGSKEIVEIYNSCPIVLNLHSSPKSQTPIGEVDFINPRTFEVPACNGFQLVDRVAGLENFLLPEVEVATYGSEEELIEKARYYLEHPGQREAMANKARARVLANHTYYHRMEKLLDICLGPLAEKDGIAPSQPVNRLLNQAATA